MPVTALVFLAMMVVSRLLINVMRKCKKAQPQASINMNIILRYYIAELLNVFIMIMVKLLNSYRPSLFVFFSFPS